MRTGNHIRPWETNVIKRLRKQNQTITKKCSMITSINQKKFGRKLKTFFLEYHNQLINVLVWTYLVTFTVQWHQSWKNSLTDFTWRYTAKSPPITTKTFRFPYISVLFVQNKLKLLSRQKSTGIDNLPPGLLNDCGSIISKPLCDIINLSIRSGKFSFSWNVVVI